MRDGMERQVRVHAPDSVLMAAGLRQRDKRGIGATQQTVGPIRQPSPALRQRTAPRTRVPNVRST